jgi:hypothetical protein
MNYFTHSSPRSWKLNPRSVLIIAHPAAQPPGWLLQCSDQKVGSLIGRSVPIPLSVAGDYEELNYPANFQDPACELQAVTTLQA